jgi:hypothetical protein
MAKPGIICKTMKLDFLTSECYVSIELHYAQLVTKIMGVFFNQDRITLLGYVLDPYIP